MAFRFKPKDEKFFDFFADHAKLLKQSAELMSEVLFEGADRAAAIEQMDKLEEQADEIVADTMRRLHNTFITPFDREDIHVLIEKQDDIIHYIKGVVELMHIYDVGEAKEGTQELAAVLVRCAKQIDKAVGYLNNLKKTHLKLEARCNRIIALEGEGDQIYRNSMAKLFRENTDPIDIIKWKEILSTMEDVLDLSEALAKSLKRVVLKYA